MAFLPGIFGKQQQSNQQQAPVQQGQQQPQQQPMNGNGSGGPIANMQQPPNSQVAPGGNQNGGQGGQGGSNNPLDQFFQLMQPSKETAAQLQARQQQMSAPLFGDMTPDKIQEHVGKTNFAQNINPESVQKALGGDQQEFMNVLNQVAQNAFSASLQMSKGMVEHGVNTGTERFSSSLDSRFRDLQLKSKNSENPALQHPIGQALLGTVKQQIATANPKLSAEQVHAKAEEMFMQFGQLLTSPQNQQQEQEKSQQGTNWLNFLDPEQTGQV